MTALLIGVALIFAVLTIARISGARRADILNRWPVLAMALGALFALARGQFWFALGLAGAACLTWVLAPPAPAETQWRRQGRPPGARPPPANPRDAEDRAVLGVGPNATADEIRAAYRAKMARAHPDRGGSHAEAARLTEARDRLLKR